MQDEYYHFRQSSLKRTGQQHPDQQKLQYSMSYLSNYRQNLQIAGCAGNEVLMVGNNTHEDLAAMELGCDAYLVTDWLLDPVHFPIDTVKHGRLADFADWAETLPAYEKTGE